MFYLIAEFLIGYVLQLFDTDGGSLVNVSDTKGTGGSLADRHQVIILFPFLDEDIFSMQEQ
jgi:hypothetical protein